MAQTIPAPQVPDDSRAIWDERYARLPSKPAPPYDAWLEPWLPEMDRACRRTGSRRILDLGCGRGQDSLYLADHGYRPVAADFSLAALRQAGLQMPLAGQINLDLRLGLPFAAQVFGAIVANLSLHYFPWQQTLAVLEAVRGCLVQEGLLLARFNSTNDTNYGAAGCPEIEPHAYLVGGMYKRFFDSPDLERLFSSGWHILHLAERVITRYGDPKVAWEIIVIRI